MALTCMVAGVTDKEERMEGAEEREGGKGEGWGGLEGTWRAGLVHAGCEGLCPHSGLAAPGPAAEEGWQDRLGRSEGEEG